MVAEEIDMADLSARVINHLAERLVKHACYIRRQCSRHTSCLVAQHDVNEGTVDFDVDGHVVLVP